MARLKNLLIVLAALFLLSAPMRVPRASALSPEEETKLGERFLNAISSQYEIAEFPYIAQYINDLGTFIGSQIQIPYFPLKFYVVNETIINAFAAPGGHVFIFSGLILTMDNVDELASVLAHEIGHVSARHLAQRIERSKKIELATIAGILAGILVGGKATEAIMSGSIAAGAQAELGYSREDERQADQLGFKYADLSGFDPGGMVAVLNKIQRESWYQTGEVPSYLLTHPGAPERMTAIEVMLQGYNKAPDSDKTKELRSLFPLFHTMVTALCSDSNVAAKIFKKRLSADPGSAVDHYGLGLTLEREGKIHEALNHFKRALHSKPDSIPIMFSIGKAYQLEGEYGDSVSVLQKALDLSPQDREILYLLALSLQNLEQYGESSKIYERLTFLPPVKNEVYYNLGLAYGRDGKLGLAHYNLGVYFTKLGKKDKALFHFKKAREFAGDKPELKEKIDKALMNLKRMG